MKGLKSLLQVKVGEKYIINFNGKGSLIKVNRIEEDFLTGKIIFTTSDTGLEDSTSYMNWINSRLNGTIERCPIKPPSKEKYVRAKSCEVREDVWKVLCDWTRI